MVEMVGLWAGRQNCPREKYEWQDTWIEEGQTQETDLPRVLMLGDSISRQYRGTVGRLLAGKAHIANAAGSHCVGDPLLAAANAAVLDAFKFDVITVNNGLHGLDCPDGDYAKFLAEYIDFLRAKAPSATILWVRTTPISIGGDTARLSPRNTRVEIRNKFADAIMAERGIAGIDLYAATIGKTAELHSPDGIHFNDTGVSVIAHCIADAVSKSLPTHGA